MTTTQTTFDNATLDGAASGGAAFDGTKAEAFGGHMMSILTGSLLSSMVDIGHRTGLFAAAAESPATSEQLAARAGLCERYVREWLGAVTTGGIVEYRARRAPSPDRAGLPALAARLPDPGAAALTRSADLLIYRRSRRRARWALPISRLQSGR